MVISSKKNELSGDTIISVPLGFKAAGPLNQERPDVAETLEHVVDRKEFKIRLADTHGQRSSASMLIKKMYSWRGYQTAFNAEEQPNRMTLVASSADQTIGTITIGFDSPIGLLADDLYQVELNGLRSQGRRLCEFTKLAVDGEIKSKQVLAALFHIAFIYSFDIQKFTDLLIEVNPRHVKYYERMLGFAAWAETKINRRVNAPAVLLRLELDYVRAQIMRFGGKPDLAAAEKSLYPFAFSQGEAAGISNRLAHLS
jgi:hypothetical protein